MGRGRSSSSSGGRPSSSLFGRSKPQPSAPARQSSTMAHAPTTSAPPVNTRQHAPTPAATPAPAPAPSSHAPPAVTPASSVASPLAGSQAQVGSGGGLMSGILGTVVQGMAFGTGSAVAHRAVDAIAGPRTVVHEHKTEGDAPVAATTAASTAAVAVPAAAASSSNFDDIDRTNCKDESSQFKQCINGGNLSNCQFLFDVLSQCRSTAQQNKNWNY